MVNERLLNNEPTRIIGWIMNDWVIGWRIVPGWMNGWIDWWMDGWMDGWVDGRMDDRLIKLPEWLSEWLNKWMNKTLSPRLGSSLLNHSAVQTWRQRAKRRKNRTTEKERQTRLNGADAFDYVIETLSPQTPSWMPWQPRLGERPGIK